MTTDNLINALIKAQQEIGQIVNDATNPFFKSNYATLKNVIDTVKPVLNENGIYFQQKATMQDGLIGVETVFIGHGGQLSSGFVFVPPAKATPQDLGSALSYAKRYSLSLACGVASTDEDDDAETIQEKYREPKSKPKPKADVQKPTEESNVERGAYVFKGEGDVVTYSTDEPEQYLAFCRKFLDKPKTDKCQKLYGYNKDTITAIIPRSTGDTRKAFEKMQEVFDAQ